MARASIHAALERLEAVHLALHLAAAPPFGDGILHRIEIATDRPDEPPHRRQPTGTRAIKPRFELEFITPCQQATELHRKLSHLDKAGIRVLERSKYLKLF